jgi:hypothetical protein
VTTDRKANRSFSFIFAVAQRVAVGDKITATATRNSTGDPAG